MIPLDFVAGTHGHFLEYILNRGFGCVDEDFLPFNNLGTSHKFTRNYCLSRRVYCRHWFEQDQTLLEKYPRVIRIVFDQEDLLLVSSLSLLRANDLHIDNDQLHVDTVEKLNNEWYRTVLKEIYQSYPFLDKNDNHVPRYVLREFFKFGFADPNINGYWKKLQAMLSIPVQNEARIKLKCFYQIDALIDALKNLQQWIEEPLDFDNWLPRVHQEFMSKIRFINDKNQCDQIIHNIVNQQLCGIPDLTLFQESYINGNLERIFKKEMPFNQPDYFKNTHDVLQYITTAPNL